MISRDEIMAMDELIKAWDEWLTWERDKYKQMHVILEDQENQIRDNIQAVRLYKKNIQFLQKNLLTK
jgi:hypothetical protein